jgi:hypothetical protein
MATLVSLLYVSCKRHHPLDKDSHGNKIGNCYDGIQNQDETKVDCGGVCKSCAGCDDGVQNGGETGIDCGGSQCNTCSPPSTPNNCNTLSNKTYIVMGGTSNCTVYGAYLNTANPGHGIATVHMDLNTNFNSISSYDIDLGAYDFANMPVGTQRVYTTVGSDNNFYLQGGQAFVTITQGGFNFAQYYGKAGQQIYFKKISSTLTQVWFCGLYTEDTASPQNTYYFSVSATF